MSIPPRDFVSSFLQNSEFSFRTLKFSELFQATLHPDPSISSGFLPFPFQFRVSYPLLVDFGVSYPISVDLRVFYPLSIFFGFHSLFSVDFRVRTLFSVERMSPKTRSSNKTAAAKAAEARTRERERAAAATLEVIRRAVQKYATGGAPKAAATSAPEAAPVAESEEPTAEGQFQALHSDDFFFELHFDVLLSSSS